MTENQHIINLQHITKSFGGKKVLDDINLYVRKGEFLTLLGPSGCGKTTMLRLIAGFANPDEGSILLEGKNISDIPPYQRPLNTVFQRYALFPHLDVYDNIAFGLKLKKMPEGEIDKNTEKRQDQATNRARSKREPKGLLVYSQQEGNEAQDSGEYGQQDGCDLGIPSLQVGT